MVKLHKQLEQVLKIRINSNSEIIPAIKRLSELGKFDKPKEIATFAIILDRLGQIEDDAETKDSLQEITEQPDLLVTNDQVNHVIEDNLDPTPKSEEIPAQTEATTSPDAPQEPEKEQEVQTPVETPIENTVQSVNENKTSQTETSTEISSETTQNDTATTEIHAADTENVVDTQNESPTVSSFTPENITDPQPENPTNPS